MGDSPRRPHTGRRRNDAAKAAILDATFRLLSGPGAEALTIDAIAAEAGVGRQTIYRWWPPKGAVVADALARHARVVVPEKGHQFVHRRLGGVLHRQLRGQIVGDLISYQNGGKGWLVIPDEMSKP